MAAKTSLLLPIEFLFQKLILVKEIITEVRQNVNFYAQKNKARHFCESTAPY
jgi:hypothetical protein